MLLHPDAVAEQGAARHRTAGINGQDSDPHAQPSIGGHELSGYCALASAWVTGYSDHCRMVRARGKQAKHGDAIRIMAFQ
jgi:hypothetical protein